MLVVHVTFKIKPEYREEFLNASIEDASSSIKNERGCKRFDILMDLNSEDIIYFYEIYETDEDFELHLKSPHFLKWKNTVKEEWFLEPFLINQSKLIFPG